MSHVTTKKLQHRMLNLKEGACYVVDFNFHATGLHVACQFKKYLCGSVGFKGQDRYGGGTIKMSRIEKNQEA